MSTYLYLQCNSHTPPLQSPHEVGQHLRDLPRIREEINWRQILYRAHQNGYLGYETDYGSQFTNTLRTFLMQHPHCDLQIVDEYGDTHPLDPKEEE
ncbi:hypothetical protein COJE103337_03955 [Corynebacterium jeikeium]|uniref:hypothetical protein n=1 Tax=Corynebacterium jeikeium TaxID=38289 RepID=UPI0001B71510|nr:hypothetical protein [Corynebacterium jeikeium]EEW17404.1 hypothetical protein HMPREF0297_0281 [Corynebacterium jeikeium ATCC 43734]OOD30737.1 hypothetical protein BWP03_06675 [Corynebacterium jeikeium]WCZ54149.1 hypothetical protein CJEIK_08270 [Corynebacterium jeikeium]SUY80545.1 Uncharacterised protein [Corynebacterium jeikeium]